MTNGRPSTTHPCPGNCGRRVRRTLFACRTCWRDLPSDLREAVVASHRVAPAAHLTAMGMACDWYRTNPLPSSQSTQPAPAAQEERCELTDLLAAQCARCKGVGGLERELLAQRARLLAARRQVAAKWRGECDVRGEGFEVGAAIRRRGTGWRAECCAEEDGDGRG